MKARRILDLSDRFEIIWLDDLVTNHPTRPKGMNQDDYVKQCFDTLQDTKTKVIEYPNIVSERDQKQNENTVLESEKLSLQISLDAEIATRTQLQTDIQKLRDQLTTLGQIPIV